MRIQFKQEEIVAALRQYITKQGINITGRSVDIAFTAGRKEGGLLADVNISDDNFIPGIDDAKGDVVEEKPVLTVVPAPAVQEAEAAAPVAAEAEVAPAVETPALVVNTKSLFG